jgi:hypothetical protein
MTVVTLDLASPLSPSFKISGNIFSGDFDGFVIPQFEWYVVDMMVQPAVPLAFNLASLTGDRVINITGDTGGYWTQLTTAGGTKGVQYTVQLEFSGESIIAQSITATAWTEGEQNLGGNNGTQWW